MEEKINDLLGKIAAVEQALSIPGVANDQKKFRQITSEHKYLCTLRDKWEELLSMQKQLKDDLLFVKEETDEEMIAVIREEIEDLEKRVKICRIELETLLVPPDPNDNKNIMVEIRAGTGGDEAAIFVGDVVRMYKYFSEAKKWRFELITESPSDSGGYKEFQFSLSGENVHRLMKYEAGTHRVQRVPETETQGRVHTSAITIAVLIEPDEDDDIVIDESDLRIDTYRSSGAGGQHVNTTDSAVRITHIPTGVVATCQQERSQIKNRVTALRVLKARIAEEQRRKKEEAMASTRAAQVGTGDRSGRIRTYNFPQNRLTDHRIDLTLYHLDQIMEGDLDQVIGPLVSFFYQRKLEAAV